MRGPDSGGDEPPDSTKPAEIAQGIAAGYVAIMRIPVFVSSPTKLSGDQESARAEIIKQLAALGLEPRALGRSDYPSEFPLREVLMIAKHCAGGVIMGFSQFEADSGTWKRGSDKETTATGVKFPTQWNNLEAGILFALRLPLLIFREKGIEGGVFDSGVTDVFVHDMPVPPMSTRSKADLKQVFLRWQGAVRHRYYTE